MGALSAFLLMAVVSTGTTGEQVKTFTTSTQKSGIVEAPKDSNGLTLYNAKGEVVARCEKTDDSFSNCKLEPGVTLDDVMNAWVHAYQDLEK